LAGILRSGMFGRCRPLTRAGSALLRRIIPVTSTQRVSYRIGRTTVGRETFRPPTGPPPSMPMAGLPGPGASVRANQAFLPRSSGATWPGETGGPPVPRHWPVLPAAGTCTIRPDLAPASRRVLGTTQVPLAHAVHWLAQQRAGQHQLRRRRRRDTSRLLEQGPWPGFLRARRVMPGLGPHMIQTTTSERDRDRLDALWPREASWSDPLRLGSRA